MVVAIDENDDVLLDYEHVDGYEEDLASLLFFVYSGYLSYFVANTLPQYVNDKDKMAYIVQYAAQLVDEYNKQMSQEKEEEPVIDPLNVFNVRTENNANQ